MDTYSLKDILFITKLSPDTLERITKELGVKFLSTNPIDFLFNEIDLTSFMKILNYKNLRKFEEETFIHHSKRIIKKESTEYEKILFSNYNNISRELRRVTKLHFKYSYKFNLLRDETPLHAAYIIHGKVINYLNFINESIKNRYLCVMPYFRILNEAILLACYFLINQNEKNGKRSLKKWYREEISPSASELRNSFKSYTEKHQSSQLQSLFGNLLFETHDSQSNEIHNSFNHTRKTIGCKTIDPLVPNIEYLESSNYVELISIQEYIPKNILTLLNGFKFCYCTEVKIFDQEDENFLEYLRLNLLSEIKLDPNVLIELIKKFGT